LKAYISASESFPGTYHVHSKNTDVAYMIHVTEKSLREMGLTKTKKLPVGRKVIACTLTLK